MSVRGRWLLNLPLPSDEGSWDTIATAIGTQLLPRLEMSGADLFSGSPALGSAEVTPVTYPKVSSTFCSKHAPQLVFVLSGQAHMSVNNRWVSLPQGRGVFLPEGAPCVPYVCVNGNLPLCDWLWFQVHPFGVVTFRARLTLTAHFQSPSFLVADRRLYDLFTAWRQEQMSPNAHKVASKGLLCAFFALLMRGVPLLMDELNAVPSCPRLPVSLQEALQFLHRCYDKPLCLKELAQACGVTPEHLCRLFRRHLGTTPWKYLGRLRLRLAERLLRETTLSVTAVATLVGFNDLRHFQRLFRRAYGVAPSCVRGTAQNP